MLDSKPVTDSTFDHGVSLHYGDCFKLLKALPEHSIDALISDPPYGLTNLPWDKKIDWPGFWQEAKRVCKPTAIMVLFSMQPFTTDLINSNRSSFRYELIWHKTRGVGWLSANQRPLRAHENILVFADTYQGSIYYPQKETGFKPYISRNSGVAPHYGKVQPRAWRTQSLRGERHPKSVLQFPQRLDGPQSWHPTQKPLALMQWLVRSYSHPEDIVFDPFMGSGTTGVACVMTGRKFIGVEREPDYYAKAQTRLAAAAESTS